MLTLVGGILGVIDKWDDDVHLYRVIIESLQEVPRKYGIWFFMFFMLIIPILIEQKIRINNRRKRY